MSVFDQHPLVVDVGEGGIGEVVGREDGGEDAGVNGGGKEGTLRLAEGGASKEAANVLNQLKMANPQLFKDKDKVVSFGNVSNNDFRAIYIEGPDDRETRFICNVCEKECSTVHAVKTHITKVHVKGKAAEKDKTEKKEEIPDKNKGGKRRLSSPEVQDKEDKRRRGVKEFNPEDLEYWSKKKPNNTVESHVQKDPMEIEMDDLPKAAEPRLIPVSEFEEWKADYLHDMKMKDAKIKSLEDATANSKELLNVIKIEKESLEYDNNDKSEKIDEMERMADNFKVAFVQLKAEIDRLAANKEQSGDGDKVKNLKKEIKELNKEVTDSKEKKNEALQKLKEETNKRAKAESDNAALRRQMRNMTTIAEEKKREENQNRSRKDKNGEKRSPIMRRIENRQKSPLFSKRRSNSPRRQMRFDDRKESKSQERRRGKSRSTPERNTWRSTSQERRSQRSNSRERRGRRSSSKERRGRRSGSKEKMGRSGHGAFEVDDCPFWLHGKCHFGKRCTKGDHVPEKEGIKTHQQNQDFFQSLTGAPGRGAGNNQPMMVMMPASQVFGQGATARGFGSR